MTDIKRYYDIVRMIRDQSYFLAQDHSEEERRAVAELPVLILEVGTNLPDEAVAIISDLARKLFDPGCLLDVRVVSDVTAGAKVIWKGVYYDGSIAGLLDDNKETVNKIIWSHFNIT